LSDNKIVDVEIMVVLGVGDCGFERLLDLDRNPLVGELEIGERGRDLLAPDELGEKVELLRADAQHARRRLGFVLRLTARVGRLGHR
jgi:hypothetical protein